jgi:hypothetical protein
MDEFTVRRLERLVAFGLGVLCGLGLLALDIVLPWLF